MLLRLRCPDGVVAVVGVAVAGTAPAPLEAVVGEVWKPCGDLGSAPL